MAISVTPLADAAVITNMRDPHFRIGWLQGALESTRDDIRRVLPSIKSRHDYATRRLESRIDDIERTLRLAAAADEPAPETPIAPVAA